MIGTANLSFFVSILFCLLAITHHTLYIYVLAVMLYLPSYYTSIEKNPETANFLEGYPYIESISSYESNIPFLHAPEEMSWIQRNNLDVVAYLVFLFVIKIASFVLLWKLIKRILFAIRKGLISMQK